YYPYYTGQGFDVHGFCAGDFVTLAGVRVPHTHGLQGHSDADVVWHALCDALLGAMGCGDIGEHFPDDDERWRGADSAQFLEYVQNLLQEFRGTIINIDITVICEKPKITPHKSKMMARTADILRIQPNRINVKATTTEKLGFLGRGEAIAAMAICTIQRP
ncbi:MAG: 2-C-methyl-D-erythritol 2,4-cyclodiphosphate synthase, partial [Pseudomonadota bacterium]